MTNMMIWIEDIGLYKDSDNEYFQKAIGSMVKSIQWSDVDVEERNLDGAKQFIQKNVLNYFQKAANDPEAKLRLTDALRNLFTHNIKGLNVDVARTKIQKFCFLKLHQTLRNFFRYCLLIQRRHEMISETLNITI